MRRPVFAFALAGVLVLGSASAALATTTRIPDVSQEHVLSGVGSVTPTLTGSILSVRNEHHVSVLTAADGVTQTASSTSIANWDLDLATFTGTLWGTSDIVPNGAEGLGGMKCMFECSFVPGSYGSAWTGHSLCHGYGALTGWQSRSNLVSQPYGVSIQGYSFVPGDRTL